MKQCPSCQNQIAPQLVVCPFCGHDFEASVEDVPAGKQTMMGIPATNFMAELNQLRAEAKKKPEENAKSTMFGIPALGGLSQEEIDEEEDAFEPTQIIPSMDIPSLAGDPSGASMTASIADQNVMRSTMPGGLPALSNANVEAHAADQAFKARPNSKSTMMLGSFTLDDVKAKLAEASESEDSEPDDFNETMVAGPIDFSGLGVENTSAFSKMQPVVDHAEEKSSSTQTGLNIRELAAGIGKESPREQTPERQTVFSFPSPFQEGGEDSLLEMSEEENESIDSTQAISASGLASLLDKPAPEDDTRQRLLAKLRSTQPEEPAPQERAGRNTMFGIPGITRPAATGAPVVEEADSNQKGIFNIARSEQTPSEDDLAKTGILGSSSYVFSGNNIGSEAIDVATEEDAGDATAVVTPDMLSLGETKGSGETLPFSFSVKDMLSEEAKPEPKAPVDVFAETAVVSGDILAGLIPQDFYAQPDIEQPELAQPEDSQPEAPKSGILTPRRSVTAPHAELATPATSEMNVHADTLPFPEGVEPASAGGFALDLPSSEASAPLGEFNFGAQKEPSAELDAGLLPGNQPESFAPPSNTFGSSPSIETAPTPEPSFEQPQPTYQPTPEPTQAPAYTPEPSSQLLPHNTPQPAPTSSQSALTHSNQTAVAKTDDGAAGTIQRVFCVLAALVLIAGAGVGFVMELKTAGAIGTAIFGASGALGLLAFGGAAVNTTIRRILMFVIGVVGVALFAVGMTQGVTGVGPVLLCAGALMALAAGFLTFF